MKNLTSSLCPQCKFDLCDKSQREIAPKGVCPKCGVSISYKLRQKLWKQASTNGFNKLLGK